MRLLAKPRLQGPPPNQKLFQRITLGEQPVRRVFAKRTASVQQSDLQGTMKDEHDKHLQTSKKDKGKALTKSDARSKCSSTSMREKPKRSHVFQKDKTADWVASISREFLVRAWKLHKQGENIIGTGHSSYDGVNIVHSRGDENRQAVCPLTSQKHPNCGTYRVTNTTLVRCENRREMRREVWTCPARIGE